MGPPLASPGISRPAKPGKHSRKPFESPAPACPADPSSDIRKEAGRTKTAPAQRPPPRPCAFRFIPHSETRRMRQERRTRLPASAARHCGSPAALPRARRKHCSGSTRPAAPHGEAKPRRLRPAPKPCSGRHADRRPSGTPGVPALIPPAMRNDIRQMPSLTGGLHPRARPCAAALPRVPHPETRRAESAPRPSRATSRPSLRAVPSGKKGRVPGRYGKGRPFRPIPRSERKAEAAAEPASATPPCAALASAPRMCAQRACFGSRMPPPWHTQSPDCTPLRA